MNSDKNTFYKEIGQRIRIIRKQRRISMKELGKRVGVTESMIQHYETGNVSSFSVGLLKKISDILEVSPLFLLGWENEESKDPQKKRDNKLDLKNILSHAEVLFDGAVYPLTEEKRKLIAMIIKSALEEDTKK